MRVVLGWVAVLPLLCPLSAARAEGADATEISKKTQNPVSDVVSIPIRNDISFGLPNDRVQSLFKIQPVLPLHLFPEVNLILRTIIPFYSQPVGTTDRASGLGDIQFQMFVSPSRPGSVIWGVGPVIYLPTATDSASPPRSSPSVPRQWCWARLGRGWSARWSPTPPRWRATPTGRASTSSMRSTS